MRVNGPQVIFIVVILYVSVLIAEALQESLGVNRWILFVPILVLLVGALRLLTMDRESRRQRKSD